MLAYDIWLKYKEHFACFSGLDLRESTLVGDDKNSLASIFERNNPLKQNNYENFIEEFEKLLKRDVTDNPVLQGIFSPDSMGVSYIHNICLNNDVRFISYLLSVWTNNAAKFSAITSIKDMSREMNTQDSMSKITPINLILINYKVDTCKAILEYIVKHQSITLDTLQKDGRGRNIFHCVLYNKNLTNSEKLELIEDYLLKLDKSMMYNINGPTVKQLMCEIDKDGFIPAMLFVSSVKTDTQYEEENIKLFDIFTRMTDFELVLTDIKSENFVHPLIITMKSKLDHYFKLLVDMSEIIRKQMVYIEQTTSRTTIEYAFDSDMPGFIEVVLDSLDKIDSFVIDDTKDRCITLFDVFFTVLENARNRHIFALYKDEVKPSHPTVELIERLASIIYTKTVDNSGENASEFLSKFSFSKTPEVNIPKPKIMKNMPPRIKKNILDEYNKKVEQATIEASKSQIKRTGKDIYLEAFNKNDYISFPYLYEILQPTDIGNKLHMSCLNQRKHKIIYEIILDHCIKNGIKYLSQNKGIQDDYITEFDVDEAFSKVTYDLDFSGHKTIQSLDVKQFFMELYES